MKRQKFIFSLAVVLFATSCAMNKKVPYFQPVGQNMTIEGAAQHEARICNDDQLAITVSCLEPEAAAPFNLPVVAYASPGTKDIYRTPSFQPYLVDIDGNITFPVLGKLHVVGLSKSEAVNLLKQKLEPYIKDPIVTVQFMNYKVTVLGEVNHAGSYNIATERVTMLEALGLAGDMTVYGRRDNVMLIREQANGTKEFVRVDLNAVDLISSPYYYLQQNDVIYVEPNRTRLSRAASTNVSTYLSAVSTICSMATTIVAVLNMKK